MQYKYTKLPPLSSHHTFSHKTSYHKQIKLTCSAEIHQKYRINTFAMQYKYTKLALSSHHTFSHKTSYYKQIKLICSAEIHQKYKIYENFYCIFCLIVAFLCLFVCCVTCLDCVSCLKFVMQ